VNGWAIDIDAVCGSNVLGSRPGRHAGGEWDEVRAISRKVRRRLIGAGLMHPRGMAPDQLAEVVGDWFGRDFTADELVAWYVWHGLQTIEQRRTAARARTYRRRDARARAEGFRSFYHRRRFQELQRHERAA